MNADFGSPTPCPPPDLPWDPERERGAIMDPEREVSDEETLLRRAIADPGAFTSRGFTIDPATGEREYEPLHQWGARAAIVAVRKSLG